MVSRATLRRQILNIYGDDSQRMSEDERMGWKSPIYLHLLWAVQHVNQEASLRGQIFSPHIRVCRKPRHLTLKARGSCAPDLKLWGCYDCVFSLKSLTNSFVST